MQFDVKFYQIKKLPGDKYQIIYSSTKTSLCFWVVLGFIGVILQSELFMYLQQFIDVSLADYMG